MKSNLKRTFTLMLLTMLCILLLGAPVSAASKKTVATIGKKKYTSLQAAVKKVKNGQTIKLKRNIVLEESIYVDRNVKFTIDLNKKKITENNCSALFVNKGTVTLKNGTFQSGIGIFIEKKGTLNIKSGSYGMYVSNSGKLNISGGTVHYIDNMGTLKVSGGKITYGIRCSGKSSLTVTGGKIYQDASAWGMGAITVDDGFKKLSITGGKIIGRSKNYPPVMIFAKPSDKAKIKTKCITTKHSLKVGYAYETETEDGDLEYAFYN